MNGTGPSPLDSAVRGRQGPRGPACARALLLALALLTGGTWSAAELHAQDAVRSGTRGGAAGGEVEVGRYVFVGIGIDDYRNPAAWPRLANAGSDVAGMRDVLAGYDFEAPAELQLSDGDATRSAILDRLIPDLDRYLEQTDNLVLFFAGHGHTHHTVAGGEVLETTGYIIPHDGEGDDRYSWISIESLLNQVAQLPARHVLVILDSCHSGMALGGTKTRGAGTVSGSAGEMVSQVSRRVLTSARANEKALDHGPFQGHSLFTGWLVAGLERELVEGTESGVDTNSDGVITTSEIYSFVRSHVEADPESAQIPDFGTFKLDQRGELVILMDIEPARLAYDDALRLYHDPARFGADSVAVRARFLERVDTAIALADPGPQEAYLRFLAAEVRGKDGGALAALEELDRYLAEERAIPMEVTNLRSALAMQRRLCAKYPCDLSEDVASRQEAMNLGPPPAPRRPRLFPAQVAAKDGGR